MKRTFYLFLFICVSNWLFSQPDTHQPDGFVKTVDLSLDYETARPGYFGSTFQFCEDISQLAYFNVVSRSIKYFDLISGKLMGETSLEREGPNSVPGDPVYFHYHNKDSIFVFSEFQNSRLFLINSKGVKIKTFNFDSDDNYLRAPFPRLSKVSGAIVVEREFFYLAFNISGQRDRNGVSPILKYNMNTGEFNYLKEPLGYNELELSFLPKVGQYQFYESRIAMGPDGLLVNFPLDQNLYSIGPDGSNQVDGKSQFVDQFKFLSKENTKYDLKNIEYRTVVFGSARYFGIFYDKYRNLYYRLVKLDNTDEWKSNLLSDSKQSVVKKYSLISYDLTFNKLSETIFSLTEAVPEKGVFLGPDGLWVLMADKGDEDIMTVGLLKAYE